MVSTDFVVVTNAAEAARPNFVTQVASAAYSRVLSSFRSRTPIDSRLAEHPATQVAYAALNQLLNTEGKFFSGTVVDEYLKVLKSEYNDRFCYSNKGVIHLPHAEIPPFEIAKELHQVVRDNDQITDIAIPYDNRGHHIVIYVHRPSRKVEYYDPQGARSADGATSRGLAFSMRRQIEQIAELFFGESYHIAENTSCHQLCLWRCAIWGLYYIEHRLLHISAEELQARTIDSSALDVYRKQTMAQKIEQSARAALAAADLEESCTCILVADD